MEVEINWFKPSGKWYGNTTIILSETEVLFLDNRTELENHIKNHPYHNEFIAVCDNDLIGYPIMILEES
ncbi:MULTISPECIES: hypothetical protein [Lactococcus]|uniref:hypothetical protein n=1 Tax=Lactococcus TaxID=1357 RepID=UPI0021A480AF|nr:MULTISPECIES: hypothetical protein [Lactococcus]MBS5601023.1 hypothetical protein [Lactococcus lactis]MCT3101820.1 hypothetical protein [Lactococcus lactis]